MDLRAYIGNLFGRTLWNIGQYPSVVDIQDERGLLVEQFWNASIDSQQPTTLELNRGGKWWIVSFSNWAAGSLQVPFSYYYVVSFCCSCWDSACMLQRQHIWSCLRGSWKSSTQSALDKDIHLLVIASNSDLHKPSLCHFVQTAFHTGKSFLFRLKSCGTFKYSK